MFDFDVNAVAAECAAAVEATLAQEIIRMEKGYYMLDDEAEAFEIEDEAEEIDAFYSCLLENPEDGSTTLKVLSIYAIKEVLETGVANLIEKLRM